MAKKLKDYLKYHIGGELLLNSNGEDIICRIMNVDSAGSFYATGYSKDGKIFNSYGWDAKAKLRLRPIKDLTDNEITWLFVLRATANNETINKQSKRVSIMGNIIYIKYVDDSSEGQDIRTLYPEQMKFLLSVEIDLFELIAEGLAIPKKKIDRNSI